MPVQIKNPVPMAHRNLFFASAVSYLGAVSFGFMIGYSSPALSSMEKDGKLTKSEGSLFASIATFGALLGCPLAGWLVERLGRKLTLLCTAAPFLIGWLLIAFSPTIPVLHLGRLITGISSGMVCVGSPLYVAEISPKNLRGLLGSGVQLGVTVGIFLVYALGLFFSWKMLAILGVLPALAGLLLTSKIPETPRYFLTHGDKTGALRSLAWLRGPVADVDEECRDIEESLPDKEDKFSWSEFKKPELLQPLKVGVCLMLFQQCSGINVVMFYTVTIFQSAGFGEKAELATMVIGLVQVIATVAACVLMDKAGRRQLLFISGVGMAVTCITLGYYYHLMHLDKSNADSLSWLALGSLVIYIIAFSLGWGPIPMLVMSEVFPVKARGPASAITTGTNWIFAFIITKEFPYLVETIGQASTFWLFGVLCLLSNLFVWRTVPETKGKSLEDIELYFMGRAMRGI